MKEVFKKVVKHHQRDNKEGVASASGEMKTMLCVMRLLVKHQNSETEKSDAHTKALQKETRRENS